MLIKKHMWDLSDDTIYHKFHSDRIINKKAYLTLERCHSF